MTGVQTCALPIYAAEDHGLAEPSVPFDEAYDGGGQAPALGVEHQELGFALAGDLELPDLVEELASAHAIFLSLDGVWL